MLLQNGLKKMLRQTMRLNLLSVTQQIKEH